MSVKNLLSSNPTGFYLRKINKPPDKLQKGIENIGEYTSNRNWFIVELFMDELYFTITEIIDDSTQYIYTYIYIVKF